MINVTLRRSAAAAVSLTSSLYNVSSLFPFPLISAPTALELIISLIISAWPHP